MSDDYYEATVLTVSQAREAVQNNPEWVELPNLEHLTAEVAAVLARSTGLLQLDGLRELPADVAEALSNRSSDDLNLSLVLDGLAELSVDAAQALAPHEGRISLSGLSKISLAVASSLAESEWDRGLTLNGLATITPDIAAALAKCRGPLCLDGITQLTPDSARALTQREAPLSLKGLTSLTTEVAKALAAWVERTGDCLELSGLAEAPAEALKTLRSQPNIYLPDTLEDASDSDTDDCARCPECGKPLRSSKAQQCFECGANWRSTSSSNIAATADKADAVRAVSQQFKDRTNTVIESVMAHLRDDNAKEILGPGLSPLIGRGSLKSIVTFALYADVLRMVRDMVMADGEISDEEVKESLGLLSMLAAGFAKVRRKEYASFTQLTPDTARQFLSQYESDAGLFGHANEATKWAGVTACRNIEATCGDSGPLNSFGGALVSWADSVASADGMSTSEQQHLDVLRELCSGATPIAESASPVADAVVTDAGLLDPADVLTAEMLKADPTCWRMRRFTHVDDEAADLLRDSTGVLVLNGVVALSPHAAACLGSHAGGMLELNGLREISDEVAAGLSTRTKALYLDGVAQLTDAAAMHLSQCAAKLSLRGLNELADTPGHLALAAKLAAQSGDIHLDGLQRIAPQSATALAQHYGRLFLRGLTSVDDAVLDFLWKKDSIEMSPVPIRNWFVQRKGHCVGRYVRDRSGHMGVLQSLSTDQCDADAARAMVEADMNLSFDELRDISPEVAVILADSSRDITISRLSSLPEASAKALERHTGTLAIGSLENLSLEAAKALAKHAGRLAIESTDDLPEDVVAVLSPRLEEGKVLTAAIAEQFLADDSSVNLSGFTSIEDDAAIVLCGHKGDLELDGVSSLSPSAACILAKFEGGTLSLGGLTDMPNDVAETLSFAIAPLHLYLSEFTPEVQETLRRHPSFRIDDSRLAGWLLEKCGFEDGNEGQAWISEGLVEALCEAADKYTYRDPDSSDAWLMVDCYHPFDEGFTIVKQAGNREIHLVDLQDEQRHLLVFIGRFDKVRERLDKIVERLTNGYAQTGNDVEVSDDDEQAEADCDDDEQGTHLIATVDDVQEFLEQYESEGCEFLDSYGALDLRAAVKLATDFPWGGGNELCLAGLKILPVEIAAALSTPSPQDEEGDGTPIVVFPGLRELKEDAARALSKRKWCLQLPNLKTLNAETATHLGAIPYLIIGVQALSGEVAEKLAAAKELTVSVPRLSEDAAVGLSAATGMLCVDVKEKPSEKAVLALKACRGTLFLQGDGAPS